jgi:MFS transporter, AAHS family, 4-hydroxybenzoate transporter
MRAWSLAPADLGPVFSATLGGALFGSALFGWIGDRYGRKIALVGANLLFGVFTLAAAFSTGPDQMFWLRLFGKPWHRRRHRGFRSCQAGAGLWLADPILHRGNRTARHRRRRARLPESVKFMALHERHHQRLRVLLEKLMPGFKVPEHHRFVVEDERQFQGFNPVYLFREGLAVVTPLTWLLFALNLMGFYFLLSWTPTLLTTARLPPADAALAGALLQVGGTVGGLTLSRWMQRHRFLGLAIMFVVTVPVVGALGYAGLMSRKSLLLLLLVTSFIAGFLVLGIQSGLNVLGAMIYPTSLRANGSGWQLGIGRIGSIVGPLIGGLFAGMAVPTLYMWSALPFAAGAMKLS